jgi:hypothetical protein
MDLAAVFLLSLLGGYYLFYFWRLTGFETRRSEGHHLYFRAAAGGVLIFLIAFLIRLVLVAYWDGFEGFDTALVEYIRPVLKADSPAGTALDVANAEQTRRAQWVVTAGYSLLLGVLAAWVLNIFTSTIKIQRASLGPLDRLLFDAQLVDLPVNLTLKSGKTYIGLVQSTPDPVSETPAVTLLPMLSGHRDERGRLAVTTDYQTLYQTLNSGRATQLGLPEDWFSHFKLVIPAESILTASLFDTVVYAEFNPQWRQRILDQDKPPPPQELIVEVKSKGIVP